MHEAMRARDLDPLSQLSHFQVVWSLIGVGRYEEAFAHANGVLETFPTAHYWIGMADLGLARYSDAIRHFETIVSRSPNEVLTKAHLGFAYGLSGRKPEAEKILDEYASRASTAHPGTWIDTMASPMTAKPSLWRVAIRCGVRHEMPKVPSRLRRSRRRVSSVRTRR